MLKAVLILLLLLLPRVACLMLLLQTEQSVSASWASLGSGVNAKKLDNVTAPTNQLTAAECNDDCLWNNRHVLNGTAMDAGRKGITV